VNKRYIALPAALLGGVALAVAVPLSASAHVRLTDNTATAGSYDLLTFKVPNESATATTDKLVLHIPESTPFASVSYVPVPGWTTTLTTAKLATPVTVEGTQITDAVTTVTWTADDGKGILDNQLQEFSLSVGPVPDVDSIALTATQTYTDGSVVEWADTKADAAEPAPVLYVNATPPAAEGATTVSATPASSGEAGVDVLARVFGIVGLVIGAIGLVVAIVATRRSREGRNA
jgi:uncharacterized protein YcnI